MRVLSENDIDRVVGGIGIPGAVVGAVVGAGGAAISGGNTRQIVLGATFGALSGATGGMAGAAMLWSRTSGMAGYGVSAALGLAGAGVNQTPEVAGRESDEDGGS